MADVHVFTLPYHDLIITNKIRYYAFLTINNQNKTSQNHMIHYNYQTVKTFFEKDFLYILN